MPISFFVVDPQYIDGTELSLVPPSASSTVASSTTIVIWRLVVTNGISPKGLYLPIDKSLVLDSLSTLFPQLSSSATTGPDLERIEACLANSDTFTLFLATETLEAITIRQIQTRVEDTAEATMAETPAHVQGTADSAGVPKMSFKVTKIVGCLTLITLKLLMSSRAHIEDLVVSSDMRGQGLGRGLMKRALDEAVHVRGCKMVDLTSKPDRVQARALYESLGFQIRNTGAFRYSAPS